MHFACFKKCSALFLTLAVINLLIKLPNPAASELNFTVTLNLLSLTSWKWDSSSSYSSFHPSSHPIQFFVLSPHLPVTPSVFLSLGISLSLLSSTQSFFSVLAAPALQIIIPSLWTSYMRMHFGLCASMSGILSMKYQIRSLVKQFITQ